MSVYGMHRSSQNFTGFSNTSFALEFEQRLLDYPFPAGTGGVAFPAGTVTKDMPIIPHVVLIAQVIFVTNGW
jgi:hypothetical protein